MRKASILLAATAAASSCTAAREPIAFEDGSRTSPDPEIVVAAKQCGWNLSTAEFFRDGDRKYVKITRPEKLNPRMADCLARLFVKADYGLRTDDEGFDAIYADAWTLHFRARQGEEAREWLKANNPSLVVPMFDGSIADLAAYVRAVEALCRATAGTASVDGSYVSFPFDTEWNPANNCVYAVALASNLASHGVDVSVEGIP